MVSVGDCNDLAFQPVKIQFRLSAVGFSGHFMKDKEQILWEKSGLNHKYALHQESFHSASHVTNPPVSELSL